MREKILITGASGFIGAHLIEAALHKGLEVHAGIRKKSNIQHLQSLPVKFVVLDYKNPVLLKQQLQANQYQYIIHAAGATRAFTQNEYNTANVESTINLMNAVQQSTMLKKFIFISSLAAVGPLNYSNGLITEDSLQVPVTAYGRSKLLAEDEVKQSPLSWIIIRPTAVYGPGEKDLLKLIKGIEKGWDVYIGKKEQTLSFVYVKDLATVTVNALFENVFNEAFNISDGQLYSRYKWADIVLAQTKRKAVRLHFPYTLIKTISYLLGGIGKISGKPALLNSDKLNELVAANWGCSIQKAENQLNFKPAYDLDKGLAETIDWYKKTNDFRNR